MGRFAQVQFKNTSGAALFVMSEDGGTPTGGVALMPGAVVADNASTSFVGAASAAGFNGQGDLVTYHAGRNTGGTSLLKVLQVSMWVDASSCVFQSVSIG